MARCSTVTPPRTAALVSRLHRHQRGAVIVLAHAISADERRLLFLRSGSGTDPVQRLWCLDLETGSERCLVDPGVLADDGDTLPPEERARRERARRERAREQAGGILRYSADRSVARVVFALWTPLHTADRLGRDEPRRGLRGTASLRRNITAICCAATGSVTPPRSCLL